MIPERGVEPAASADVGKGAGSAFRRWLESRVPFSDSLTLTQRNVYILPTGPGLMLVATLLLLLVTSINYQLNLGYLLTFLLAGSSVVAMHACHATLRGLTMSLVQPDPQFAHRSTTISISIQNARTSIRHGIGLSVQGSSQWMWTDVPAQGSCTVHVAFRPMHRGLHRVPTLTAETRYPMGIFRVWTVWRPAAKVLVYPAPEDFPPPLPPGQPRADGAPAAHLSSSGEYDGIRAYRRGDPMKLIVWKKMAKADELVSRDAQPMQHQELWLDRQTSGCPDAERQLSRLCAWVLSADQQGVDYGLRLGAIKIAPSSGAAHRKKCLEALALC